MTLDRAYGHVPRELPNVLEPIARQTTPLHAWMLRVDWMLIAAGLGLLAVCFV